MLSLGRKNHSAADSCRVNPLLRTRKRHYPIMPRLGMLSVMTTPSETSANKPRPLRIERIISGGDGLARHPEGFTVFVPRTAPGDVVEVEYTETHRSFRRARVVRVITPGPDRVEATCPYYDRCGGCQLQHLTHEAQLQAKANIVIDCLRRLGGVTLSQLDVEPSPIQFGYRNRISLAVRSSGSALVAGYRDANDPNAVVDVESCPLAEGPINTAWASLRAVFTKFVTPGRGDARVTVRATADGRVGLAIESVIGGTGISESVADLDAFDAAWWLDKQGYVRSGKGNTHLHERWGDHEITIAGAAFLQVNRVASAALDDYVREQCRGEKGRKIVDAYCGFGLRALALASDGAHVSAIDVDRHSIVTGTRLAAQHGLRVRFVVDEVERALRANLPADIVVLNPPRRGVAPDVIDTLLKRPPNLIIYVSCDPATLARDIKRLGPKYELAGCHAFDLFPQTAHVETVASLKRIDPNTA